MCITHSITTYVHSLNHEELFIQQWKVWINCSCFDQQSLSFETGTVIFNSFLRNKAAFTENRNVINCYKNSVRHNSLCPTFSRLRHHLAWHGWLYRLNILTCPNEEIYHNKNIIIVGPSQPRSTAMSDLEIQSIARHCETYILLTAMSESYYCLF